MSRTNDAEDVRDVIQSGYRYALSLTHCEHDAEDLVQQACLRVYRSRGRLVSRSYLFAAVRNLFIDQCRRRDVLRIESLNQTEVVDAGADHAAALANSDDIESLLAMLRPEEREVLYLNCVEEFSAAEIGRLMGKPRGTVLSLLSRSKARLAEHRERLETEEHRR